MTPGPDSIPDNREDFIDYFAHDLGIKHATELADEILGKED